MAAIVDIDQPVTELQLQAGQSQALGFDLVNIADRPLHVALSLVAEPGSAGGVPDWLALDGEKTLRLAPKETRKVALNAAPPAATPTSRAGFRLKVVEVSLPEENTSVSELVQVAVAAAPPIIEKKRPWKLIGAIAAAVVLLLAAGGGWLAYDRLGPRPLPDVEGRPLAVALTTLEEAGVPRSAITEERPILRGADGNVTRQSPAAGTPIEAGLQVTLTVPREPSTLTLPRLPDDATRAVAEATFGALGLQLEVEEDMAALGTVPGLVVAVDPLPGSTVEEASTVRLRVLSANATVPPLLQQVLPAATRQALEANFELLVTPVTDDSRDSGVVLAQTHTGELARGAPLVLVTTQKSGGVIDPGSLVDWRMQEVLRANPGIQHQLEGQLGRSAPDLQFRPWRLQ